MSKKIVLVEDEPAIRENYASALLRQGYIVDSLPDRHAAEEYFQQQLPDLVLLDISLGDEPEAGFEICRYLRTLSTTIPIIFLSARDSDLDTISGLRLGADDYLTKNITLDQLSARVAALFRRIEALNQVSQTQQNIDRGQLTIDPNAMRIYWQQQTIDLTLTEFWIVHALARNPGFVKNRDQLMEEAKIFVDDGTITSHVKRIRKKFKAVDIYFDAIETVYGMGYRWNI